MSDIEFPDGGVRGIVAIFFGFPEGKTTDAEMEKHETEVLRPTIDFLKDGGFGVFMKRRATAEDFAGFVTGQADFLDGHEPTALLWSAHGGADGSLQTADGPHLAPSKVDGLRIDPRLRLVVFSSCHTGVHARRWHRALDERPTVVGYDGIAIFGDVVKFYSDSDARSIQLQRLLRTYLLNPALDPVG